MTNITRVEREELNTMSLELYGSSSAWQKIVNGKAPLRLKLPRRGQVHVGWKVDKKATAARHHQATMLLAAGVQDERIEEALNTEVKRPVSRPYTVAEVKAAMLQALDANEYARLSPVEGAKKAAIQFLGKGLSMEISLVYTEEEKPLLDNLLVDLPSELAGQVNKLISPTISKNNHNLSAVAFVETLLEKRSLETANEA